MPAQKATKPTLHSVLEVARALPRDDRELLLVHLSRDAENETKDPGYDEYWEAELARRWKSVQDGTADLLDDDEADAIFFAHWMRTSR